jgi:hypothetical protein
MSFLHIGKTFVNLHLIRVEPSVNVNRWHKGFFHLMKPCCFRFFQDCSVLAQRPYLV